MAIEMLRPTKLMLTQTHCLTVSRVTAQPGCDRSLGLVKLLVASVQPAGCAAYQHLIVGLLPIYIRYAGAPFSSRACLW